MRSILIAVMMMGGLSLPDGAFAADQAGVEPIRVVYHFDDASAATKGLKNIRNHLKADPSTQIVVVGNSGGIDFMLADALDPSGEPYELMILDLQQQGVKFLACNNTLLGRGIPRERLVEGVGIVEAGVEEVARLQFRSGYAYIKP